MSQPEIVIMPLNFNGKEIIEQTLPSLKKALDKSSISTEVWIIDNNSEDDSKEFVKKTYPDFKFISYSINKCLITYNEAIKQCKAPYVLILNNDMIVDEDFITPLYNRIKQDKNTFSVSPKITTTEGKSNYYSRLTGHFFHGHLAPKSIDEEAGGTLYLHGGASLINREKYLELGGFDEHFFYFEDNDLSYRAWQKGYTCLFEPKSSVQHLESSTVSKLYNEEHKRALKEKGSYLFIKKNITDQNWLQNFKTWNILKFLKMIWTIDEYRFKAFLEINSLKDKLTVIEQKKYSDSELMSTIQNLKLKPLS